MKPGWMNETLKSWRFWLAAVTLVAVAFANVALAPKRLPFTKGNREFNVSRMIESRQWVEAAPVVLTNHFRKVTVTNVGDRFGNGFGFERELVDIFGVAEVRRASDPIDVRDRLSLDELKPYQQFAAEVHCSGRTSKYCGFQIYWNAKSAARDVTFIGVLTSDDSYALVEKHLLLALLGGGR